MKRALMFVMFTFLLTSLIGFAIAKNEAPVPTLYTTGQSEGPNCLSGPCPDGYTCEGEGGVCLPNNASHKIVGASCGTVTPGYKNACCISKGYSGWDNNTFKCIGENKTKESGNDVIGAVLGAHITEHKMECEAWTCTKWGACMNGTETRKCTKTVFNCTTDNKIPALTKSCHEKEEFKFYNKTRDCPENCTCSGATIKCEFENGTRVMTIFAGESGNIIVQIQDLNMSTDVTLYRLDGKFFGIFKGNNTHEIKLPDEIKNSLENRTRTKLYNESINLTEEGYYVMNMNKKARLFWIFPVREHIEAQVNATTGEALSIRNPWWGFLARDVRDKGNSTTA
jgi:hypothetical protein